MKVILHYGMHKTGSTSIQRYLKKYLTDEDFCFLSLLGKSNASTSLALAFLDNPMSHPVHKRRGVTSSIIDYEREIVFKELQDILSSKKCKNLIISGEYISNMPEKALNKLNSFLREYTQDIIAVGYIREPKSFVESNFQQGLKFGSTQFNIDKAWPMYQKKFKKLVNVFGEDNVYFWLFNPENFVQKNIILDFLQKVNIQGEYNKGFNRSNDSLSLEAIKLLYIYRQSSYYKLDMGEENMKKNNRLIIKLSELKSLKFYLHSSLIISLFNKYADDIQWIESKLNVHFSKDIYLNDDVAIKNVDELTKLNYNTLIWLKDELEKSGSELETSTNNLSLEDIAKYVNLLKDKLY